jgi:bacterioferritin (cytochrome b1)
MGELIALYSLAAISYYDLHHRLITETRNNQIAEVCRHKNQNKIT